MIHVDFETSFNNRAFTQPNVVMLFSLPHYDGFRVEHAAVSRRKSVRLRKQYNKARRHTLRLVRHAQKLERIQGVGLYMLRPCQVYAVNLLLGRTHRNGQAEESCAFPTTYISEPYSTP